jgi:hypothetical protein
MHDHDPRALDALEQMLRARHERLADRKVDYRRRAERLETARAAEAQARAAWRAAEAELATAQADMEGAWQEFDRASQQVDAELGRELTLTIRKLYQPG